MIFKRNSFTNYTCIGNYDTENYCYVHRSINGINASCYSCIFNLLSPTIDPNVNANCVFPFHLLLINERKKPERTVIENRIRKWNLFLSRR